MPKMDHVLLPFWLQLLQGAGSFSSLPQHVHHCPGSGRAPARGPRDFRTAWGEGSGNFSGGHLGEQDLSMSYNTGLGIISEKGMMLPAFLRF